MRTKIFTITLCIATSMNMIAQSEEYNLEFNPENYRTQTVTYNGTTFDVRAFENIIYVAHPVDTVYHSMNIYIPEIYFEGGTINGYTSMNAPIFLPNQIGGYMPAKPGSTGNDAMGGMFPPLNDEPNRQPREAMPAQGQMPERANTIVVALSKGYIVASPGARGRTNEAGGRYYGKAPAAIVDLKAAVRYLKHNNGVMPGDANKIISNGTSAGGAMSSLLGATGDHPDYLPYLEELGAAGTSDAIFAVSAYCPITNLEHADMAYEWQFYGINTYQQRGRPGAQGGGAATLTNEQIKVSADLKEQFPAYLNSLQLRDTNGTDLRLDDTGNGSFKTYVKAHVIASANRALENGTDLSQHNWLTIQNGKVTDLDWDNYIHYMERQKTPPAFDALDLSSPENDEFGTETINYQHFTLYSQQHSTVGGTKADDHIIQMMNPMHYVGTPGALTATHWRIRHGSKDKDTSLAISAMLTALLQNKGYRVDYALPWDKPHSGDYDLEELFAWIDSITR